MKKSFWILWTLLCISLSAVIVGCGEDAKVETTVPGTSVEQLQDTTGETTAPGVVTAPPIASTAPVAKPTEPAGTTAKPTEPAVTTPKPTEPAATTPKPSEPAATTPKPTTPAVTTPKPTEPAATTPKPTEPKPITPAPTTPVPTTPVPTTPVPTTPAPTRPAPTEPAVTTRPTEPEETTAPTEPQNPNIVTSYYDENGGSLEPIPNPIRIQTMEYDDQGRPINRRMMLVKTGKTIEHQFWYYNADGSREEILIYNTDDGELVSKTTQRWNKDGNEMYYEFCDSTGNAKEVVITEYYSGGNKKSETRETPDSDDIKWSKTEYYSNGNMSREEYRRWRETAVTTYWENGNPKESVNKKQAGGESHVKWNEQGTIIYTKTVASNNQTSTEEWFDDQGRKQKQINKDMINDEKTIWEYKEDGSYRVTVYDGEGDVLAETNYDANGQPIS